jgi:hypothetical protein
MICLANNSSSTDQRHEYQQGQESYGPTIPQRWISHAYRSHRPKPCVPGSIVTLPTQLFFSIGGSNAHFASLPTTPLKSFQHNKNHGSQQQEHQHQHSPVSNDFGLPSGTRVLKQEGNKRRRERSLSPAACKLSRPSKRTTCASGPCRKRCDGP